MTQTRHQAGTSVAGEKTGGQYAAKLRTASDGSALSSSAAGFAAVNIDRTKRAAASLVEGLDGDFPQLQMLAESGACTDTTAAAKEARRATHARSSLLTADQQTLRAELRQARLDQAAQGRGEADRVRNTLRDAGVQYPSNWDEMGSSEKDLWEERQMAALSNSAGRGRA